MARTDYYGIQTPVLQATSQAIRTVNGTVGTIAPEDYPDLISAMKSQSDYDNVMAQLVEETTTPAAIASFADGANNLPVKEIVCQINPTETGTGAKSPSNPYVIGGHTGINVTQNDGQTPPVTERTHHTDFGQTVYGGSLNVTTGVLTITNVANVYNGSEDWVYHSSSNSFYLNDAFNAPAEFATNEANPKCKCNYLKEINRISNSSEMSSKPHGSFCNQGSNYTNRLWVKDTRYDNETDYKVALSNQNLVIVTPLSADAYIEIQLTPIEVKTLLGANNMHHDCNGNIEVTYRANGALYVAQHSSSTRGLMSVSPLQTNEDAEEIKKSEDEGKESEK